MKQKFFLSIYCCILSAVSLFANNSEEIKNVYFTYDKIDNFIIDQINNASDSVVVMICTFDWKPIADALVKAKDDGKKVVVLTDKRSRNMPMKDMSLDYHESVVSYIEAHGIETYVYDDSIHRGLMHYKCVLIDNSVVITGSYNFVKKSTEANAESMILIESKEVFSKYYNEFMRLRNMSENESHHSYQDRIISNSINNVYFSQDKLDNFVIDQIKRASDSIIVVNAYFDWKPIADALIEAKNKGKKVIVLTNKDHRFMRDVFVDYNEFCNEYIATHGIETYNYNDLGKKGIMHQKYMLIDNSTIIYGSYNFLKSGTLFDLENVIWIENKEVYSKFHNEFVRLKSLSTKYQKPSLISKSNLRSPVLKLKGIFGVGGGISVILNIFFILFILKIKFFGKNKSH